jgi:hypothetical protein
MGSGQASLVCSAAQPVTAPARPYQLVKESTLDVQKQALISSSRRIGSKPIEYEFVTIWRIEAPIHEVCEAISDFHHWSKWWQGVEQVMELERGAPSLRRRQLLPTRPHARR